MMTEWPEQGGLQVWWLHGMNNEGDKLGGNADDDMNKEGDMVVHTRLSPTGLGV